MCGNSGNSENVLLVLLHWAPSEEYISSLSRISPGIRVIVHQTAMYDTEVPKEITDETWASVTILLTWKLVPAKEQAPNLRYVQLISAGCNQLFGQPIFEQTDIAFCTANGVHPPQIAEWVFATFLGFQHHLPEHYDNQKLGNWVDPESDEDTEDAVGLRIGILGYGCIGRQVARVGKALGMSIHAFTLHERPTPDSRKDDSFTEPGLGDPDGVFPSKWYHGIEQLNEFLGSDLDLLVITLPLTSSTSGMLSSEQFNILSKRKAFISNAGRGGIIDTNSLIEALKQGKIRGAALDVTDPEPLPEDHPLWKAPNVLITPHCSGNSNHYNERVLKILAYNLDRLTRGISVVNRVDRALGY
ncbi:D-3-phosphoglycerate dehydrogenase [Capronia epimyces CBS 606.96]|uniref:D-3-phosphoglycerate dehydrogenase n=1 Tax=Capronia epimyces CBS 606.96 TaxID=1182542 RepID=W9Y299_9EURO|nr:D-3-phosphoglycerate dehydrogenase [Capronia epimyces CBS 606.96]EXJ86917.1 D-3-phosphoglycerate dehydrogenase [Capronia epimyces CBS 606.96]